MGGGVKLFERRFTDKVILLQNVVFLDFINAATLFVNERRVGLRAA